MTEESVQKSKNSKLISTKITQMQLLHKKKPNIIQKNRSWFQQNFLKFDKISLQKSKYSKLISTKHYSNAAPLSKKTLHNPEKSKLASTKFFKICQKSVQKSKNSKLITTKITQKQLLYPKNLT